MKLAFDKKSARHYDRNGHLVVDSTIITKASVNPYYGNEIPNHKELGLIPDKVYNLLRDPQELKKALPTFGGLQLLIKHIPVDSDEPQKEYTIGSVGTDLSMDGDDVKSSLRIWDKEAINLIESEKLRELSSGYAYTPDMTAGVFNGEPYDGIMRDIHGNHVALVERGRIGRDAIIADSLPIELMEQSMKLKKGALAKVEAKLKAKLGLDADIGASVLKEIIDEVIENTEHVVEDTDEVEKLEGAVDSDDKAEDEDKDDQAQDEDEGEKAKSERKELEDTDNDDREAKKDDKAMDAASIALDAENRAVKRVTALFEARELVKPLIGQVALDSAEQVYKMALDHAGVDTKGVHPSAFKAMASLVIKNKQVNTPKVALDSAQFEDYELTSRFKR